MMKRHWCKIVQAAFPVALVALTAMPASAQIVQITRSDTRHSVGFNLGYLWVQPEDGRDDDDVLVANLSSADPLFFEINDFNHVTFGGEWLYAVSHYVEVGAGIGYYQRTVPSVYRDLVNASGTEIAQDLKLRMAPIDITARFLPVGRGGAAEPYVGGGVTFINWRYSESGEFVDSSDGTIFRETYKASGTQPGWLILAGVRFPFADALAAGVEFKYQNAVGDTNAVESQLLGDKIDLTNRSLNFTFHFRF